MVYINNADFVLIKDKKNTTLKIEVKRRKYYNESHDKIKKYRSDNKDKRNQSFRKRRELDLKYKLACNLRSRTSAAFKSKSFKKVNKTFDFHSFFKNCIIQQLYGNMTLEKYGSIWQMDHCLAIATFNLLDEKEMKKCFNWINLRPMYATDNIIKGDKIDMRLYLLQKIKSNYLLKLNVKKG